jgi:transcriptional regulator with XRE-family HTH domain
MIRHAGIDASEKARQSFGIRFKTVREKRGLSQAEVATMLGLSSDNGQAYISKVEKGKRNLTLDTMIRLAAIVRVDVRDLLKPID